MGEIVSALVERFGLTGIFIAVLLLAIGGLSTAVVVLFKRLMTERDGQIDYLKTQGEEAIRGDLAAAETAKQLTVAISNVHDLVRSMAFRDAPVRRRKPR